MKVNNIIDVEKVLTDEQMSLISTVDKIIEINEENQQEVLELIENNACNIRYFIRCIEFAMKIRPKSKNILIELLVLLIKKHEVLKKMKYEKFITNTLISKNINIETEEKEEKMYTISDELEVMCRIQEPEENYQIINHKDEFINSFTFIEEDNDISDIIKNDDVDAFIRETANADFNSESTFQVEKTNPLYLVSEALDISYMEAAAFYGAVKIFKFTYIDGSFPEFDVIDYAIAGGNKEIIKILAQKGADFGLSLDLSIMYHRNEICDWIMNNYKHDEIVLSNAVEWFNDKVFFFGVHKYGFSNINFTFSFLEASKISHISLLKYILENSDTIKPAQRAKTLLLCARYNDDIDLVKFLDEKILTNAQYMNRGVYQLATMDGKTELIKYLVETCHIDPTVFCNIAFRFAALKGDLEQMKFLKDNYPVDVNSGDTSRVNTALHIAAKHNNLEIAKYLVEECHANINKENKAMFIPLESAIKVSSYDVFQFLSTFESNKKPDISPRVLIDLVKNQNYELLSAVAKTCKIDERFGYETTAIHVAALNGDIKALKCIKENKLFENPVFDNKFNSPLMTAIVYDQTEAAKYIIDNLYSYKYNSWENSERKTVVDFALEKNNLEVLKYLIKENDIYLYRDRIEAFKEDNDVKSYLMGLYYLYDAFQNEDYEQIKDAVLNKGIKVNTIFEREPILIRAVENGNTKMARFLIDECHGNPNTLQEKCMIDNFYENAVTFCDLEFIKHLVEDCHYDLNNMLTRENFEGYNTDIEKYLLEKSDLSDRDVCFKTIRTILDQSRNDLLNIIMKKDNINLSKKCDNLLSRAITNKCNLEFIFFLMKKCDVNKIKQDIIGRALKQGMPLEVIKYIVEVLKENITKDMLNYTNNSEISTYINTVRNDHSFFKTAVKSNDFDMVKKLVDYKELDINRGFGKHMKTLLIYAVENDCFYVAKYLIEVGHADVEIKVNYHSYFDKDGKRNALHVATLYGLIDMVKLLLEVGNADVEAEDEFGMRPIHYAAQKGSFELVKYLVEERHADVQAIDKNKRDVITLSIESQNVNVLKYFVEECHLEYRLNGIPNSNVLRPIDMATKFNNKRIIEYMVNSPYVDTDYSHNPPFEGFSYLIDLDDAKLIMKKCNNDIDYICSDMKSVMTMITSVCSLDVVKYFVEECFGEIIPSQVHTIYKRDVLAYINSIVDEDTQNH